MATTPICPSCGKPLAPSAPKGLCQACLLKAGYPSGTQTDAGGPKVSFVPPTIEELAAKFPQLEILELIGRGGMGAVYKARQKQLGRIVALKILPPSVGDQSGFAERFTREARALAALNHPGIVTLYEFGQADGLFFFLMEFVDGVNLRQLLERGRISPREALAIVPQICDALQYAHDQSIVHRDIKPENILLDRRGRVKVADFGVARLMGMEADVASEREGFSGTVSLTEAGKVMGTPQYMAPEQKDNPAEVDHRADIYSLGVVFYQMLTGELPGKRIDAPSKKFHLDVRLDEVVLRALEAAPDRRYQQVSDFKTQVETIANEPAPSALETPAKFDWRTWSPSQPPLIREICAHMTDAEKSEGIKYGMMFGILGPLTVFGPVFSFALLPVPLGLILGVVVLVVCLSCFPLLRKKQREFLCSTEWARQQGIKPDELRRFAPDGREKSAMNEPVDVTPDVERRPRALPESRFSRTAIWGAAWALVFFAVVPAFRWHEMKTHEFETAGLLSSPLMIFVSFGILLPAFIAPLGATILGWISISQIRRSAGRLDGLGLALFDGLLFPLLALDFLIVIIAANLIPDSFDDNPHNLLVLGAMIGSGVADVFIVRRVWRTVSKSSMASAVKNAQTDFQKTTSYHPQSATSDDSGSAKRRLSSLAILGAIWGILFLPLCKFHPAAGVEFWVAYDYSQLSHLSFTRSLLIIPPMISFSAPFGMTILGWLAVRQIRRSRGRIIGLGLAVFDGLLFPLLICDVLIIVLAADLIGIEERPTGLAFVNEHFTFLDFAIVALAAALVISSNWWVSRAVWRAVSKVNTGQISTPESRGGPGASI